MAQQPDTSTPEKIVDFDEFNRRSEVLLAEVGPLKAIFTQGVVGAIVLKEIARSYLGSEMMAAIRTAKKEREGVKHQYASPGDVTKTGLCGNLYVDRDFLSFDMIPLITGRSGPVTKLLLRHVEKINDEAFGACQNHVNKLESGEVESLYDIYCAMGIMGVGEEKLEPEVYNSKAWRRYVY